SAMFKFWFPKLWKIYADLERDLNDWSKLRGHPFPLRGAFPDVPFFDSTTNTGKKVVTPMHVDFKNAIFGMCIIAVFGRFNYRTHGLLVLKELKLMLQLKPGDIAFIPSALLTHGNTELAEDDIRRSWTLFNGGGLFRFRDAGFATVASMSQGERDEFYAMYDKFFQYYMDAHMSLDELRAYHGCE
ncbi:hypothetical protein EXIGLDRAFT_601924, partial [Exidia glandulosa HHB12029]